MAFSTATSEATVCNNFIDGAWLRSKSDAVFERRNPANQRDLVSILPLARPCEVLDAIQSAERAQEKWKAIPAPTRGKVLVRAAALLEAERESMAALITREEGKTKSEAISEVTAAVSVLEYYGGMGWRLAGETLESQLEKRTILTVRNPVGVVGLITPWNFPVAVPLWKIAPALVCGNAAVWKPSHVTPLVSMAVAELFVRAGLPGGVLNMVNGLGSEVGEVIVTNPAVGAISFTSSYTTGKRIYSQAASALKKVQCETGGKNASIVLGDADLENAADSIVSGAFGCTGQRCTATSRVVAVEEIADELVDRIVAGCSRLKVGDGADPTIAMGPVVTHKQLGRVLEFIEAGHREGELVAGGHRLTGPSHRDGLFAAPTVFDRVKRQARLAQEEIFGPVLCIIRVHDFAEAIEVANDSKFGMAAAIFTRDSRRIQKAIDSVECGILHINCPTVGGEPHAPFGGIKLTGVGIRECGSAATEFYSELRVVYTDYA